MFHSPSLSNVIIQWGKTSPVTLSAIGTTNGYARETITYPISFSEICWFVASPYQKLIDVCMVSPSLSSCTITIANITNNIHSDQYAQYIGIGY